MTLSRVADWRALGGRFAVLALTPMVLVALGVVGWTWWATRSAVPRFTLDSGEFRSLAWSPDGRRLAAAYGTTVRIWEADSGRLVRVLFGHTGDVNSVAWSWDGQRLASGSDDNTVRVWDAATGGVVRTLTDDNGFVLSVAWSGDGQRLASGSSDRMVRVWDTATGGLVRRLTGHSDWVWSVAWSGDGQRLASASFDNTVRVWDPVSGGATGGLVRTLAGHGGRVWSAAWSKDGQRLAGGNERSVHVWDTATGEVVRKLTGHSDGALSVAWSGDGQRLASGSGDHTVRVWDAATGGLVRTLTGHSGRVNSVAWSGDGQWLASGSDDHTVRVWDPVTGRVVRMLKGDSARVWSVAWSGDGRRLASGSDDHTVRVWNSATGGLVRTLTGHRARVRSVAWSGDGQRLASGSYDHTLRVWEAATGGLARTLTGHNDEVLSVAWSGDGQRLASVSYDHTVRVWDVATGGAAWLTSTVRESRSVAWSGDGQRLASGSADNRVRVWNAATGELVRMLTPRSFVGVLSVAWSADGRRLASGSDEVSVWDAEAGELVRTLTGHGGEVNAVAWSRDGQRLASGSGDNTVRVWDAGTGGLVRMLTGHSRDVNAVAWSRDGQRLASGSEDNTLRVWATGAGGSADVLVIGNLTDEGRSYVQHESSLRYVAPGGEDQFVTVSFEGWETRRRLADYRDRLRVSDIRTAFGQGPTFVPRPDVDTESLAFVRRNQTTFWTGAALYLTGLIVALFVTARPSAAQLAQRFFPAAGLPLAKKLSADLFVLTSEEQAFAAVWPQDESKLVEVVARQRKGATGRYRLYLLWRDADQEAAGRLGQTLGCSVIPLDANGLERALADGKAAEALREMEEPILARTDPYDEARAITDATWFYGRGALLEALPGVLRQGQHAGVFGLRKVGKTSLVNQLRLRMIDVPVVWLDCQAYEPVALDLLRVMLERLRREVARLAGKKLPPGLRRVLDEGASAKEVREEFVRLHEFWKTRSRERFIVILDEIDKWFPDRNNVSNSAALREYVSLFRVLRALAQERDMFGLLVVAYRPEVNRHNHLPAAGEENPMYMSFQERYVGFLDSAETRKMIREIGAWKEIVWTEEALGRVVELCGGHPMLSRFLASDACLQGSRKQVGLAEVDAVAEAIRGNFRKHRIGSYFEESVWATLTEAERAALAGCARGVAPAAESEEGVSLEQFGLIDGAGRVQGTLLRDWLLRRSA